MLVGLVAMAVLLAAAVCGVLAALYRKHAERHRDHVKQPPMA